MKRIVTIVLAAALATGLFAPAASAQMTQFVAETVAKTASPAVVSLDSINLFYGSVSFSSRQQQIMVNLATGLVFRKDGFILTNDDRVRDAKVVKVTFSNGRELDGHVVGLDDAFGLGVVKVDAKSLPVAKVGDPSKLVRGDSAIAIGYSGGFGGTVTYGIISAIRDYRTPGGVYIPDMIQTDAAINDGNQGGPLLNSKGEVVGVHSRFSSARQNTSFFLPINIALRVANDIIATGGPAFRPWLGILPYGGLGRRRIMELSDDLRMFLDMPDQYWDIGVLVWDVNGESSAFEYGLRREDLIVKMNGQIVKSIGDLERRIFFLNKKEKVVFGVIRRHRYRDIEVVIGSHPKPLYLGYI
jgi:serine protease Do